MGYKNYCSKECSINAQTNKLQYHCSQCQQIIYKTPSEISKSQSGNVFCSRSCAITFNNKLRINEKANNFIDGAASYRIRALREYGEKCSICNNCEDVRLLDVHHIDNDRLNNNLDNLIVLCVVCHAKITRNIAKLIDRYNLELIH